MHRSMSADWASGRIMEDAALDILIPTCNRPSELAVTLAGLAAQEAPVFRLVVSDQSDGPPVYDNATVAAIVRVLRAQGGAVELLRHLPRRGLAEHRQFLFDQARAEKVLYLDDDVWLEPGALGRMNDALDALGCGFVGMAPQGLSYLDDRRPEQTAAFEPWEGPVTPERIRPDQPSFNRWPLHSAANLSHLSAELGLEAGTWIPYKVAWLGGCTLYRRQALEEAGAFRFWTQLPPEHCGEDVVAQWRVMEKAGGAGILPTGAVHLESPTTVIDRRVEARDIVLAEPDERDTRAVDK